MWIAFNLQFATLLCIGCLGAPSLAIGTKTIAVRIYVDEEEPRTARLWQETLGRRLDQASTILSRYGSIRFSVTKFGAWESDNSFTDFARSLSEFEKETKPFPAELAIGFTSQYRIKPGLSNLGGTRGPMRKHILIREGSPNVHEVERLEVLVHELSHYMGAAHSGRSDSVMRPVLGDGQSRARAFQIKLDDPNANIVRIVSQEMATFHVQSMHRLTVRTKVELRGLYAQLAREFPDDEVASRYAILMDKSIKASVARQRQIQAAKLKATQHRTPTGDSTKGASPSKASGG
jgi:hypothetical protein